MDEQRPLPLILTLKYRFDYWQAAQDSGQNTIYIASGSYFQTNFSNNFIISITKVKVTHLLAKN